MTTNATGYVVSNGTETFVRLGEMAAYAGEMVMSKASYLISNYGIDVLGLFE